MSDQLPETNTPESEESIGAVVALSVITVIVVGVVGGSAAIIAAELLDSAIEMRPHKISGGALLAFVIFATLLIPLTYQSVKQVRRRSDDTTLLDGAEKLILYIDKYESIIQAIKAESEAEYEAIDSEGLKIIDIDDS